MTMTKLLLVVVVAACGGSDSVDLAGTYMVTSDVGSMPCGTDAPIADAPAYLLFQKMNLLGHDYFEFQGCPDATGTNCSDTDLFSSFFLSISGGWKNTETFSSFSSPQCELGYIEATALLQGTQITIDGNQYTDTVCLPEAQCTTDEAGKRGTSMPCAEHEHIVATKQ